MLEAVEKQEATRRSIAEMQEWTKRQDLVFRFLAFCGGLWVVKELLTGNPISAALVMIAALAVPGNAADGLSKIVAAIADKLKGKAE